MKRAIAALAFFCLAVTTMSARPRAADESLQKLMRPVVLAPPNGLPDVAECRGVLSQMILDLVHGATEDPAATYERNRREHPNMLMMPPTLDCASALWRALKHGPTLTNFARVPVGTDAISLRQYPIDPLFDLRSLTASVGTNVDLGGGLQGYQGENAISADPNNPQHLIAFSNTFYRDPNCVSPTGGAANTYGTMTLYGSTDGGATWTYNCAPWPAAITGGVSGADAYFGSDPALAWDNAGNAYACYMLISENSSTGTAGASIVVAKSTNNGASWTSLGTVVNRIGNTTNLDDKQMFAIDNTSGQAHSNSGRLYVIWDEGNSERVAHSDNGTAWTTVQLPSNTNAIGGNVVIGADGTVYVIWNRLNTPELIVFSKSTDGGTTWTTPITIATLGLASFGSNNTPPAQDQRGVNGFGAIDVDRNPSSPYFGTLYVSFPDFPVGTSTGVDIDTYVVRSTDGGATWSSRVKVNDDNFGATQIFPWISVDQSDGTVNVSWYDTRLDPLNRKTQLVYARSKDGAVSFEPNILVMDGGTAFQNAVNYSDENSADNTTYNGNQYGDYSGIAASNRQVHPLWTDSRNFFPSADSQSPTRREDNASSTIVNCTAPSAISAPSTNPTTQPGVVVSWSAPASWGTNATGGTYSVYRATTAVFPGGTPLASGLTSTSYYDLSGVASTTYYYFVRATNNCPGTTLTPMSATSAASNAVVFGASGSPVGILRGTVTSAGNPISGATVTAGTLSATTNASGLYQFPAIDTGTYSVNASATGYNTATANNVAVSSGATTVQDFSLTPSTGSACFTDTTFNDFALGTGSGTDLTITPGDIKLTHGGGEQLDQSSSDTNTSGVAITNTTWVGETFTPATTGTLTKLDVELFCSNCTGTTSSLVVNIHATSSGLPTGAALATTTIPAFSSGSGVYYTATFSSPATLTAGTVYAFTVHASTTISAGTYAAVKTSSNLYSGGAYVQSTTSGSSWSTASPSRDLEFHTYITTPFTYPSPGTFTSSTKDSGAVSGTSTNWTTLSWTAVTPGNTTLKFQVAASTSPAGPFTFVGPDGTAATFFTTSGASLAQFNGQRYLKYKAYLSTTDTTVTPTLNDVTVCETVIDCASEVPTITPSAPTVCGSSTGNTASGPAIASTYSWAISNGTITGGATSQTVTYTAGATGTLTLTLTITTASGCMAVNSSTVTINPIPATPTASNGGPYCASDTVQLSTATVGGATYSWTGPNGFSASTQNPTRTNVTTADAGTYFVTVTVNGCTSAAGTTIVVVNPIPATPAPSNGGPYCEGATISLSTAAVGGATYSWSGPNGFTSSAQNPTRSNVTTADAGTYSVTVTVSGCTSAAGTTDVVINAKPAAPVPSNGGPYCEGATIALSTPTVGGATYSWTGPNGFSSPLQNPTRSNATTADAGTYSVTVTVNGCTSDAGTTNVVVNPTPATPTAANGGPYCEGATISLSTPFVSGATYSWTGPNGFTSTAQNPTRSNVTTADAGTYSVTITVNGCTSAAGSTGVTINPIPATPTASNGSPYCEGATISLSTPFVTGATYGWTGPNGFTSALQNPTRANATIADGGTYSVTITVNGCTSSAGTTNVVVNATPATPPASNGGPYCEGATISLSTPSVGGATYFWSGPNGFTSTQQSPTRDSATTADAGTYSVTVTVNGCTSAAGTTNVVVNTIPATPTATNGGPFCEGATITLFTPTVTGASYSWTGPNGFTSTDQNPTRSNATTADAGTYSVTITVSGCTSSAGTTNVVVNPTPATPTASNGGPYCEGATIALSTPFVSGATYAWSGPNGFTSTQQNPTRSSATTADAGTYSVTITVNGCTSAAGTTDVVVNATPATPIASNGGPYCEGATINLSTTLVSGATYTWTGPNGFTSTQQNPTRSNATTADAGTYSVTITVNGCTSAAGSTNVVVNTIPATPTATNGGPFCEGATITLFTPTVSGATYSWTGPNGFTASSQNPTRSNATTADAGTYSVTITVNGCTSAAGTTDVVVNATPATPTASNGGPYCQGATVQLSTPTVSGATYSWTGPNSFTSSQQNPTATDAGTYFVTITVNGCTSAAGSTTVVVNPIPATPTASNGGPYCEGAQITLSTPTVAGATYAWTGPNGFSSTEQNPVVTNTATTADAGTYFVTVTTNGCTSAAGSTSVVVNTVPATPTASNGGPYCEGGTISLSTDTVTGAAYAWTGPNGYTSTQQNPTITNATPANSGTYSVTVAVNGCTSAAGSTNVVVNPTPATPTASNGGPYCVDATISLTTATVTGATYAWTGPNSFTSSQQNPTISNSTLANAGTYSVTVTVNGCTSLAGTTDVVVNSSQPTPTATNGGPYCEGATIQLSTDAVTGATYAWTGPNGYTSTQQNPTISNATTANAGTYSVTVTVGSCTSAAGSTNVVVNTIPSTPTASNGGPYCSGGTISLSTPTVSGATYLWSGPSFTSTQQNPTISNATTANAGTYSVTVTVNGCTSAAGSTNVVVNNPAAAPTITPSGATTFCHGGSVTLTSSNATGNQWYLNGNPIAGQTGNTYLAWQSGSYTVQSTATGCTSAASAPVTVTVNVTPMPSVSANGPLVFCEGGSVTLTSSNPTGNQWYRNGILLPSETGQSTIATTSGVYAVTTTLNGCTTPDYTTVVIVNPKPDATINVVSPMYLGASSHAYVKAACTGATFTWGITNGTITGGAGTPYITFVPTAAGTTTLTLTVTNVYGCSDTKSTNVTVQTAAFGAPPYIRADATGTTTASVNWAAVTSADHYEIFRGTDGVNFTLRGTSTTTTFSDSGLTASSVYFYRVRAVKADSTLSSFSAIDPATTVVFTEDPLMTTCQPLVRAAHITQLRTAINLARAAVGLGAFTFTDSSLSSSTIIKGVHITELRTALSGVLTAISVTPSYTDPTLASGTTNVKAEHVMELRDLIR